MWIFSSTMVIGIGLITDIGTEPEGIMGHGVISVLMTCRGCYSVYRQISATIRPEIDISPTKISGRTGTHGRGKDIGTNTGMDMRRETCRAVKGGKIDITEAKGEAKTGIKKNLIPDVVGCLFSESRELQAFLRHRVVSL